jgi:hypothetical protein
MEMTKSGNRVTVTRTEGDQRVRNESDFWYKLRNLLKKSGEDVIKKEMSKDGHLVSDGIYYVRSRHAGRPGTYGIYDSSYALRDVSEVFNKEGSVTLSWVDLSE